ncbi:MAG: phosphoribosylanthranilate isomerase [Candidatus Latescibacteria bacterium]|jgi:phosphoribosylanthranilate isomerase|nr:phosphoribosylanthranilate isomerase [Candidatus Latescibacterota bacterium]
MNIAVKICGITRAGDALLAEEMGARAIGFVFFKDSPRYIIPEKAGEISGNLGPFTARVGVFVDEEPDTVISTARTARLTAVQLHGSESREYIGSLKGLNVIKAFRIGNDFDPGILKQFNAGAFLLDAYSSDAYGGTGKTFDWRIARKCSEYGRIIIAGGLNASNINEAVRIARPWGVDVSSGIESSPGIKDSEKMRSFFHSVAKTL